MKRIDVAGTAPRAFGAAVLISSLLTLADCGGTAAVTPTADASTGDTPGPGPGEMVWSAAATKLVAANRGGGFAPPPPAGSECRQNQTYTLTVSDRKLVWHLCQATAPGSILRYVDGERILTVTELNELVTVLNMVTVSQRSICGADAPVMALMITTPAGTREYLDDFYSCEKRGIYIDGINEVFQALRPLVR